MALKISFVLVAFLVFVASIQSKDTKPHGQDAFSFLQHLQGCHKGQTVKGLHELKRYLENFGYLDYGHSKKASPSHANDDEFDELLESAVKAYQAYYHLKATGGLDSDTLKQMMLPRCGVSDIINGTKPMSHRKMNPGHQSKNLHTVAHYRFFQGRPRWSPRKTHLTYSFSSSAPGVGEDILRSVSLRAFKRWQDASHFTFQEAPQGSTADIVIGFHRGNHGDGAQNAFDGPRGTLAHAAAPEIGLFHYDADENWSTNPSMNQVDLESVAVHEIGHVLGLHHSEDNTAIMYAYFRYGLVKRDLQPDDIEGIRVLYS